MFATRSGTLARLRMRVLRQLLRWDSREERNTKKSIELRVMGELRLGATWGCGLRVELELLGVLQVLLRG